MTTDEIRKAIGNNLLQQALTYSEQLALPDEFKLKLVTLKAKYREYNDHIVYGDLSPREIDNMRAGLTVSMLRFLSDFEIVCVKDFKNDFVGFVAAIQQEATEAANAPASPGVSAAPTASGQPAAPDGSNESVPPAAVKEEVLKEANEISKELGAIDIAENKAEIKPGVIERVGNFLAKFQDKDSAQYKILSNIKDGVKVAQSLGKKYNSIAQWFMLPQIPNVLL